MCQILNLMHRVVQYRAEFYAYQEILPCTIPPYVLNLSDTPNLLAYMQIRKCHFFYSVPQFQRSKQCYCNRSNITVYAIERPPPLCKTIIFYHDNITIIITVKQGTCMVVIFF